MYTRNLKILLVVIVAMCALSSSAMGKSLAYNSGGQSKISLGYSKYTNNARNSAYYGRSTRRSNWREVWRARMRYINASRRSFSATVIQPGYYGPSKRYTVSYDKKTAILKVGSDLHGGSPHGRKDTEYNARNGAVTIYGPYNSTKTVYYKNGYSETLLGSDGRLLSSEYCGIDTYNEKKDEIKGMITSGAALLKEGGSMEEGKKSDLKKAITIITAGQQ